MFCPHQIRRICSNIGLLCVHGSSQPTLCRLLTRIEVLRHVCGARSLHSTPKPGIGKLIDKKTDLNRFLIEIGTDPKEARYWLKNFKSSVENSDVFMVVTVEHDVMDNLELLEKFASSISFLKRNSMSPLIVCGSGPAKGSFNKTKEACVWNAVTLNDMLEGHGTNTRVLYPGCGVVTGEVEDQTGNSKNLQISTEIIQSSLATQHLPILLSYGETASGQIFPIKSWELSTQVSKVFQPKKVMFVNSHGGFLDEQGKVIPNVNLPIDLETAEQKSWYRPDIMSTMMYVCKLLGELPIDSSVVITSADTMLRELFSHRGSGTFFRSTEAVHKYSSLDGIDLDRLRCLLHRSFMKTLVDSYFNDIAPNIHAIYLSESYSGVAILLKSPNSNIPYMCKFAVTNRAQGQGTGELLWDRLIKSEPCLFWRSKIENPINTWYFKKCEGSHNNHKWLVFWYGVCDPNLSVGLIKDAVDRKDSFIADGDISCPGSDDEEERMGG
ncbi:N-acetylglutamate synthase, mitochondrial-like [Physella acuta]|uniref:N-acetylglutamate synthase, mitochondrial-like n=1 Tax=Physella acuta TaxID=109671 RepID=UPI0027DD65F4|nr:N-acetylglutamate synthase, mitochondrial-like [Physella acuta]